MKIILVRHTETIGNVEKRFNGFTESEYTQRGYAMKEALIESLATLLDYEKNVYLYSSPTTRAARIAQELSETLTLPLTVDDALMEFNFGIFDGLTVEEAEKKDKTSFKNWMFNHLYETIPEGDSYEGKYQAVDEWMKRLLEKTEEEDTIVLISHGATLRCILTMLLEIPLEAGWHIDIPLGGIAIIDRNQGYSILKALLRNPLEGGDLSGYRKNFVR